MSDRREFLKHLAGTTTGIIFVNCGFFYMQLTSARYGADRNRSMKRIE